MQPLEETVVHFIHGSYSLLVREQLGGSPLTWQVILERANIFYFFDYTIHVLQDDPSSRCRMNDCLDYKQSTKFTTIKCLRSSSHHVCSTCKEMPVTITMHWHKPLTALCYCCLCLLPSFGTCCTKPLPMATDEMV